MTYEHETLEYIAKMRDRWEQRAQLHHRYFTESVNFDDPDAWDRQAEYEVSRYLDGLDRDACSRGRFVEIGCGPARLLSRIAPSFAHSVGLDIAPTMVREARRVCTDVDGVDFVLVNGIDLGFLRDHTIDLIVMHAVAIHLPVPIIEHYIHEAGRLLRAGGHFRFTVYSGDFESERGERREEFLDDAARRIPDGVEHLTHGPDYEGHLFGTDEIAAFISGFRYQGSSIDRVGESTYAVDLWM